MIRNFKRHLPMSIKKIAFELMDLPNRNDPLIPPLRMRRAIGQTSSYTKDRTAQIRQFVIQKPTDTILDVGCGCGSLPYSLIHYSDWHGQYEGLDIIHDEIAWLNHNVAETYLNFHFVHADIRNSSYNVDGKVSAANYKFPYKDATFDSVFLSSVFTHMLPADLENYLSEIARMMKPNARCFLSWFFIPQPTFKNTGKGYCVLDLDCPENAVAYPIDYVTKLYSRFHFKLFTVLPYGPQIGHVITLEP